MKGVSFQNGTEFKVHIDGESWSQGSLITGNLEAVSRGASGFLPASSHTRVVLAEGTDKKVKAKTAGAFEILQEATLPTPQGGTWEFKLPADARISDTNGSLYLLYGPSGDSTALESLGQLRLNILPHPHIKDLIDTFVTQFRFALKKLSAGKKDYVEIKLEPPAVKDWASLEQVLLLAKLTGGEAPDTLKTHFIFTRQQIDATAGGVSSKSVKHEVMRDWPFSQMIHDFNQRLNKDAAQAALEDVVAEYRSSSWIGK